MFIAYHQNGRLNIVCKQTIYSVFITQRYFMGWTDIMYKDDLFRAIERGYYSAELKDFLRGENHKATKVTIVEK